MHKITEKEYLVEEMGVIIDFMYISNSEELTSKPKSLAFLDLLVSKQVFFSEMYRHLNITEILVACTKPWEGKNEIIFILVF